MATWLLWTQFLASSSCFPIHWHPGGWLALPISSFPHGASSPALALHSHNAQAAVPACGASPLLARGGAAGCLQGVQVGSRAEQGCSVLQGPSAGACRAVGYSRMPFQCSLGYSVHFQSCMFIHRMH